MALPRVATFALLAFLLAAPLPGALSTARVAAAASDFEAPVVTGFNFSALAVPQGGNVTITFDVEDASNVSGVTFTLKREGSNHYVYSHFNPAFSVPPGRHNATVQWSNTSLPGNYSVYGIYTVDSWGNERHAYEPDIPTGPAVTHGDPSQPVDTVAPVVESISFPEAVPLGSTMNATLGVTDASAIRYVAIGLVREGGSQRAYGSTYNATGLPPGNFTLTVRWTHEVPGNYTLSYISVGDVHDNWRTYFNESFPNGSRRVAYGDVNASFDYDAPVFGNVTFNGRTFRPGESLVVTFNATDESNLTWGGFEFRHADGSRWLSAYFDAWPGVPAGTHQARLDFTEGMAPGTYELQYAHLQDEHGNQAYLNPPFPEGVPTSFTLLANDTGKPDLVVAHVQHPSTVSAGQQAVVNVTVRNEGTVASGANATVGLYVNGTLVHGHGLVSLAPGANATVRLTWNATGPGVYNLTVHADTFNNVNESREDNNRFTFLLTVKDSDTRPDLVLTLGQVFPFVVEEGWTVSLDAWVRNAGNSSAPVVVHFFADGNLIAVVNGSTLGPGGSTGVRANWTASGLGNHTLSAVVDRQGLVNETREDNNVGKITVTVIPRIVADLGVDIVEVRRVRLETDLGSPGTNPIARRTVVVNVTHHGGTSVGGFLDVYARETLGGLPLSQQTIAHVTFGNLSAGQTRTFELPWDVVGTVGDVELVAYVMHFGDDPEPANNVDRKQDWVLVGGLGLGVGP